MLCSTHLCLPGVAFLIHATTPVAGEQTREAMHNHGETNLTNLSVATLRWGHVETPYMVVLWILVAAVAKVSGR